MSSTRSAGLRVLACLCLSVLTDPRGADAQKCTDPSFQVPGFTESSGGVEPREMALASFNHDPYPDLAVQHASSNGVGILVGNGSGFALQGMLSYGTVATVLSDVVAADFDHDGWDDVAVSATTDDQVYVSLSDRSGGFKTERGISVGKEPTALTFGDYNDDGHLDIAVYLSTDRMVTLLRGNGAGDFAEFFTFPMDGASQMATGDVNVDGVPDIVAVDSNNNQVYTALVDKAGSLRGFMNMTPTAANPDGLALGDFNTDGRLDLATVSGSSREAEILRGDGSGNFSTLSTYPMDADVPTRVAAADVDQDGDLDVAVSDKGRNQVQVFLGDGKGSLTGPTAFETAGLGIDVVLVDADLDGRNDIALSISDRNEVERLRNDHGILCPNPSFERLARSSPVSSPPRPIAVADFDRDGSLDFVTANLSAPSYTRYLGLGNGDFSSPEPGFSWSLPTSNAAADFDFDGDLDVAVATGTNVFVQNNNAGSLASASSLPISNGIHVVATDVSSDGKPDLVVLSSSPDVFVSLNDGAGGFLVAVGYALTGPPRAVAVADFDGDNLPDLAVAEAGADWISFFRNLGAGAFTPTFFSPIGLPGGSPSALRAVDMNGDGRNDLVVTVGSGAAATLQVLMGNGAFGFSPVVSVPAGEAAASPQALEIFDFNGDGAKDVALALISMPRVHVFQGTGGGGFAATPFIEMLPGPPGAVASGDFDRDGLPDLVVSVPSLNRVLSLMGNGAGRFSPELLAAPTPIADTRGVAHGDFDGKGLQDVVVANAEDDSVTVFLAQGGFAFDTGRTTPSLDKPVWVTADDFDSDGTLDVVVSAEGSRELGFHKGRADGTFDPAVKTGLSANPYIARSADFDFDGHPDIVVLVGNLAQYLRGNGAGGFSVVSSHPLGGTGSGLVVGDFDRDGLLDFAAAQTNDHNVVRFLGTAPGTFGTGSGIATPSRPLDFDAGDLDQDGFLDLVVPLEGSNQVRLLFGNPSGTFTLGPAGAVPGAPKVARILDYNLDGFLDVVVASENDHVLSFLTGDGSGGFTRDDTRFASVRRPTWMTVADFDSDGRTDLAVVPSSAVDGDPAGVAAIRNTNCRSRHLQLLQDVSTCDLPNQPFASQPRLRIEDDGQNLIECEDRSVVASIRAGTGSAGASLLPPTSITPSSGIASYSSLGVDQGGAGFQIQFQLGDARPKLSRRFSQALAPSILGPTAICEGDLAIYTADTAYDYYDWRLDSSPVSMTPSIDLTGSLTPGLRDLDLSVVSDTCSGLTFQQIDVTAQLSSVEILPAGPLTVCDACTGPLATSSFTGGGVVTYQWGYRITPVTGPITPLAGETNPTYTVEGADFGAGTFYLVLTVTPACGIPVDSNDVEIAVSTSTGLDPLEAFTALATNASVRLEFSTTATGLCAGIRILRNSIDYPPDPHITAAPNVWIGGADFPCPASHEGDFTDLAVSNDTEYLYSAWVRDAGGSFSTAKNVKSVPFNNTVGSVKWAYSTGATAMAQAGIRVAGGVTSIYVVSNDSLVHGLEGGPFGGQWLDISKPFPLGLPSQARPPVVPFPVSTASNGALFVTSQDGNVYAIDADSLGSVWSSTVGDMVTGAASGIFAGFSGPKNLIFAGSRNSTPTPNELRAFDVETGVVLSIFDNDTGGSIGMILGGSSVDYAGQRVFFGSLPGASPDTIWAVDVSVDGFVTKEWSKDIGEVDGSPVFLGGAIPRVVVGTMDSTIELLRASDGASLWPAPYNAANGSVKGFVFPHVHAGVTNFMFSTTGKVVSIRHNGDNVNPTLNWQITSIPNPSTPIFLPGTTSALVGSTDGHLYLITGVNTSTPNSSTRVQLGDGSASVGVPTFDVVNRVIYVGTEDGVIRAIAYPFP